MKNIIKQYRNAKKAIKQIRAGEWTPKYNRISKAHLTAFRDGKELWIGNGAWLCEISGGRYFGLWRHYVWWAAARRMTREADKSYREMNEIVPLL